MSAKSSTKTAFLYGLAAYVAWGVLPCFWKALKHVNPWETLAHRILWSFVCTLLLVVLTGRGPRLMDALRSRTILAVHLVGGMVIGLNWFTYIWAVTNGRIVEASLGYFICPLMTVFLGVVVLRERLSTGRVTAIILATAGVAYLTLRVGYLPWVSLTLACSFAFYSLLRKKAPSDPLVGLCIETAYLGLPALLYLFWFLRGGSGAFSGGGLADRLFLVGTGPVTALPLLWFAHGARGLQLTTLGLMQYISPFLQLLMGVVVYGEAFGHHRQIAFLLIWIGLAVHSVASLRRGTDENPATVAADHPST